MNNKQLQHRHQSETFRHTLAIILPALNEAGCIANVIQKLPTHITGCEKVIVLVVDDGSSDTTAELAQKSGALVIQHRINRGVGLARRTGLAAARAVGATIATTLDADGQHDPNEIKHVIAPILSGDADIVIGSRLVDATGMPIIKQIINRLGTLILRVLWGVRVSDSQSGFRAYNLRATQALKLHTSGYESDTEILIAAQEMHLRVTEVPIRAIYTEYSTSKNRGQSLLNSINILIRLFIRTILG